MDLNKLEELARAATGGDWEPGVVMMPAIERGTAWVGVGKSYDSALIFAATGPADCQQSAIDATFIAAANPAAVLEIAGLIRKQEARIDELTVVTGDQHMRLDAVLKAQGQLVTTLQEIRAQFDDGGPMQKFIDAKLAAAGVTL